MSSTLDKETKSPKAVVVEDGSQSQLTDVSTGDVQLADENDDHIVSASGDVFVVPRPTQNLADPLNHAPWKKWLYIVLISIWSGIALSGQSFLANFFPQLEEMFPEKSISDINMLLNISAPLIAPADLLFFISSYTIGLRPTFLAAAALFLLSSTIGMVCVNSYSGLYASRVLVGLGSAPTDALIFSYVENFTFVHERGIYFGVVNGAYGIIFLVLSICASYIATLLCLSAAGLVAFWLFLPETSFHRRHEDLMPHVTVKEHKEWLGFESKTSSSPWSALFVNPFAGFQSADRWSLGHTLKLLRISACNPTVWWLGICQMVFYGGYAAIMTYYSTMLQSPPWNWPAEHVSLINLTSLPTSVVLIFVGEATDWIMMHRAKARGGVVKLEDRLIILVIPVVMAFAGFLGFGGLAQHFFGGSTSQPHWFSCVFILFLTNTSFSCCIVVTTSYLAGAVNPAIGLASMSVCFAIRDLASFGLSYGITSFVEEAGYLGSFATYACLSVFVGAMAIPFYFYGERIRKYADRLIDVK